MGSTLPFLRLPNVRAIRTITVAEPASGKTRRFSGVVEASSLRFEVPGNAQAVEVDVGENVSRGQVLTTPDDETFQLNVRRPKRQ